jgi:hypothetical protein
MPAGLMPSGVRARLGWAGRKKWVSERPATVPQTGASGARTVFLCLRFTKKCFTNSRLFRSGFVSPQSETLFFSIVASFHVWMGARREIPPVHLLTRAAMFLPANAEKRHPEYL